MIIEEIWAAIMGIFTCFTYPILLIGGTVFTLLNAIYVAIHSSFACIFTIYDILIQFFTLAASAMIPAPIMIAIFACIFITIFAFLKRRLGEISIAGFRFGG